MDVDDELMDLLNTPSLTIATAGKGETAASSSIAGAADGKTLEEELFDILNSPGNTHGSFVGSAKETGGSSAFAKDSSLNLDHDLLSWLDDTPSKHSALSAAGSTNDSNAVVVAAAAVPSSFSVGGLDDEEEEEQENDRLVADLALSSPVKTAAQESTSPTHSNVPQESVSAVVAEEREESVGESATDTSAHTPHTPSHNTAPSHNDLHPFLDDDSDEDDHHSEYAHNNEDIHSSSSVLSSPPLSPTTQAPPLLLQTLSEQVEEIVSSPLPDIARLRALVDEEEYIPRTLRASVLLLLLTGSAAVDEEAQRFTASETDRRQYAQCIADCEALANVCVSSSSSSSSSHTQAVRASLCEQMRDIVVLYCQRRSAEYRSVYARVLLSVFGADSVTVSKAAASACFYSLCSNFLPVSGLQHTSLQHCIDKTHSWLRLIVVYHSPALAQHLDRIVPGWEKPAKEVSSSQMARFGAVLKGSANLDLLEKELGVDLDIELEGQTLHETSSEKTARDREAARELPRRLDRGGLVPSHWIIAFFAGCMPAEESAKLLDWAVFNGERFAGVFFVAALLELHSEYLLQCNAASITKWFESVAMHENEWFKHCTLSNNYTERTLSWPIFTRGWIHATAALLSGTPKAVREALSLTESWAIHKTEREAKEITNNLREYYAHEKNLDEFIDAAGEVAQNEDVFNEDDEEDDESKNKNTSNNNNDAAESVERVRDSESDARASDLSASSSPAITTDESNLGESLLSSALVHLRSFGAKLQARESAEGSVRDTESDWATRSSSSFVHDRRPASSTMTLWSDASEVVPCICSNQRRLIQRRGVCGSFTHTLEHYTSEAAVGTCFFSSKYEAEQPVFFAIDCRNAEEKRLGAFPRAYSLDPEVVTDGDALTHLITVLEPLASTTHIAIIGPGEEYFPWFVRERIPRKLGRTSQWESQEINKRIRESENRVNAVAVFLMKKNFRFISVLNGGYFEATKYLSSNTDSRYSLSTALVDVDRSLLFSMLGLPAPAPVSSSSALPTKPAWVENAPNAIKSVGALFSAWNKANNDTQSAEAPATQTQSQAQPQVQTTGWGSKFMSSFENIKKNISSQVAQAATTAAAVATADPFIAPQPNTAQKKPIPAPTPTQPSFVIDEPEDDGLGPREDSHKISIVKTDSERAQALAIHRMAGLRKGDSITISRAELPGAILFPCVKTKTVWLSPEEEIAMNAAAAAAGEEINQPAVEAERDEQGRVRRDVVVSRYLVVSRERFMVLDAHGGGVGSVATVKSNHHLTELVKMTFKKKDPELVTLHLFASDEQTRTRAYRVAKYRDFVTTLQKHMERFK